MAMTMGPRALAGEDRRRFREASRRVEAAPRAELHRASRGYRGFSTCLEASSMALTLFQQDICRLISAQRVASDEATWRMELAWAASGKDPGFGPAAILEQAAASSRYSSEEVASLSFESPPPDAGDPSRRWRAIIESGRKIVDALTGEPSGRCVLDRSGILFTGGPQALSAATVSGNPVTLLGRDRSVTCIFVPRPIESTRRPATRRRAGPNEVAPIASPGQPR